MFRLLSLAFIVLFSSMAMAADGKLSLSYAADHSFQRLELEDNGGKLTGTIYNFGGWAAVPISSEVVTDSTGDHLIMQVGPVTDSLNLSPLKNGGFNYRGLRMWNIAKPTDFDARIDKKGVIRLMGKIAEQIDFTGTIQPKGTTTLYWNGLALEIKKTPKDGKGTCAGDFHTPGYFDQTYIKCKSSGTLEDVLFRKSHAVVAWMVHLLMIPE